MKSKGVLKKYKSEILMGGFALLAGVASFVITLNVYQGGNEKYSEYAKIDTNYNDATLNDNKIKIYFDDELEDYDWDSRNYAKNNIEDNLENINVDERIILEDDEIQEYDFMFLENDSDEFNLVAMNDDEFLENENVVDITELDESDSITVTSQTLELSEGSYTDSGEENARNHIAEEDKFFDFEYPISGEILMEYAKDRLVYSETLEEWITHSGIDIGSDVASPVKASEDGVVESLKMDPRYGNMIIIKHENGFKTVYSNLSTLDMVTTGKIVKKGDIISGVGDGFGFETREGPHVHFEIIDNNGNSIEFMSN